MRTVRLRHASWLLLVILATGCQDGSDPLPPDAPPYLIGDPDWDEAAKAKVEFQDQLAKLTAQKTPEFAELAQLSAKLQIAMIEQRATQLKHIVANEPDRLTRNEGYSRFANFSWVAADEHELRNDETYAALCDRIDQLNRQNQAHSQWAAYREAFQATILESEEYKNLTAALDSAIAQVESKLK